MIDYSAMSDFEINCAVADKVGGFLARDIIEEEKTIFKWHKNNTYSKFDPCNSWADAGPIISKNHISIEYDAALEGDMLFEWVSAYAIVGLEVHIVSRQSCDRALRSAMIVFLMMKEAA